MKIAFFSRNMGFCGALLEELRQHHTVKIWGNNPNERIAWASAMRLLEWCDLGYLEWLQDLNLEISQIQELGKPLVAFCHGIDVMNHTFVDWRSISGLIIQDALMPRLIQLREKWTQQNKKAPPLPSLPKELLIQTLGVDLQRFVPLPDPEPEHHIVTHAYFIRPTKRIYEAVQQFHDLIRLDGDKPWKMTLVGEWEGDWKLQERSEYLLACEELIEQLRFPPKRLFIKKGNFQADVWPNFARTADIYWCTSWRESFGLSMAETVASGAYPLMNWYLGAEKIYPEKHLCKTSGEMVEKTIAWGKLTKEEKLFERETLRSHISQFDQRKAAEKIRLFIEKVCEGYKR